MITVNEEILKAITDTIVREIDPEKIYLFGSQARGDAGEDSDIDLVIIEKEPFGPQRSRRMEMNRIRKALSIFRIPKDILVYSLDDCSYWKDSLNHILSDCLHEGRLLYERS